MKYVVDLCPKCQGEEWDGTTCGICKYDVRIPWSVDDDGTTAEKSLTYLSAGPVYGVRIDVNKHTYPHSGATFTVAEALKLAARIIDAATEAMQANKDEEEAEQQSAEFWSNRPGQ